MWLQQRPAIPAGLERGLRGGAVGGEEELIVPEPELSVAPCRPWLLGQVKPMNLLLHPDLSSEQDRKRVDLVCIGPQPDAEVL